MDNFEQVSTDIIKAISEIHYEDKHKEYIKYKIMYVLCNMVKNEQTLDENTRVLDLHRMGRK